MMLSAKLPVSNVPTRRFAFEIFSPFFPKPPLSRPTFTFHSNAFHRPKNATSNALRSSKDIFLTSTSMPIGVHCASFRQCTLFKKFQNTQVRYHRTDYEGPGNFDERETGSLHGTTASHSHDHAHSHDHESSSEEAPAEPKKDGMDPEEKQRIKSLLQQRYQTRNGTYTRRAYTIGIGGPVGSGKTALTLALCRSLRDKLPMGVVTNDIFTQEDSEFLVRNEALGKNSKGRIMPVETGGCPHAAIREDVSANLGALETLTRRIFREEENNSSGVLPRPLLLCESGGDNLAANFSSELADYTIYVIDVAGGDKVPRKGGPGITQSDLLVINKIDLAEAVGASLDVMDRDASKMRKKGRIQQKTGESGPTIFASVKNGVGMDEIINHILSGFEEAHRLVEKAA